MEVQEIRPSGDNSINNVESKKPPRSTKAFIEEILPLVRTQYRNLTASEINLIIKSHIKRTDETVDGILTDIGPSIGAFYKNGTTVAEKATYYYVLRLARENDPKLTRVLKHTEYIRRSRNGVKNINFALEWFNGLSTEEKFEVRKKRNYVRSEETVRNVSRITLEAQGKKMYDEEVNGATELEYVFALIEIPKYQVQKGSRKGRPDWENITFKVNTIYGNNRSRKSIIEQYRLRSDKPFIKAYPNYDKIVDGRSELNFILDGHRDPKYTIAHGSNKGCTSWKALQKETNSIYQNNRTTQAIRSIVNKNLT